MSSHHKVVRFTPALTEQARQLLGGLNPTPARVAGLLTELALYRQKKEKSMDQSDLDNNRVPHRQARIDPEAAAARLAQQRANRPPVEDEPPTPGEDEGHANPV